MAKSLVPATAKVSLEELSKRIAESGQQELRVIIKGDVQGSVEALADAMAKLSTDKVRLSAIHAAVGAITEGDVNLAIASKALIVGFNVRPAGKATALAEENKIEIRLYSIIYNALEDVKGAMEGLLPPTLVEKQNGKAEVRQIFRVKGIGVAGLLRHRRQDPPQRQGAPRARRRRDLGRQDQQPEALQGRRREVARGLRVRNQPRGLQRPQGEGHPGVLRGRGNQAAAMSAGTPPRILMFVGVLRITFHVPHARSLKDKRRVVLKFRDRVRARSTCPSPRSPRRTNSSAPSSA